MNIKPIAIKSLNDIHDKKQYKNEEKNKKIVADKLEISQEAKYLNKITSNKNEIDIKKVEEIKNRLNLGTYKINSKEIAKKMIENVKGK